MESSKRCILRSATWWTTACNCSASHRRPIEAGPPPGAYGVTLPLSGGVKRHRRVPNNALPAHHEVLPAARRDRVAEVHQRRIWRNPTQVAAALDNDEFRPQRLRGIAKECRENAVLRSLDVDLQ